MCVCVCGGVRCDWRRERGETCLLLLLLLLLLLFPLLPPLPLLLLQLHPLLAVSFTPLLLLHLLLSTLVFSYLLEVELLLPLSGRLLMLPLPLCLSLLLVKPVHFLLSKMHQQVHQQPGKDIVLLPLVGNPKGHTL